MAIFQSNAGGAWDNAKKMFEEGVDINGEKFYKGSEPHKAAVVGDTVGDPFKDTSGPSLNILLKLMSVVALVIAPTLASMSGDAEAELIPAEKVEIVLPAETEEVSDEVATQSIEEGRTFEITQAVLSDLNLIDEKNLNTSDC